MTQQKNKTAAKAQIIQPETTDTVFKIPYPYLWLALAVLLVYGVSLGFGLTELDDTIFIKDYQAYYENIGNLVHSFQRGVFNETQDTYYRPFFLDAMLINYKISGDGESILSYHVINLLLHLGSVLLLFNLFKKLEVKPVTAFILTMVFAVHPVLSQAVAWIPGRNDTMLAVFSLSFFITVIDYSNTGKIKWLLLSSLFLLCAFFTKETAVFDAPVAFVLLLLVLKKKLFEKNSIVLYGSWIAVFLVWFFVRSQATLKQSYMSAGQIAHDITHRLPLLLQYLGKIFLPVNLSVFPIVEDTVIYYGLAALAILIVILMLAKDKKWNIVVAGISIFLLFLLPVLIVPAALNEQTFEHRLYLPIIGILLILPETILFKNKLKEQQLAYAWFAIIGILGVGSYVHQQAFNDAKTFWTSAEKSSPHSAYAVMMLASRTEDKQEAEQMFRRAYALKPTEKYLNYYMGQLLQNKDSVLASEPYLLKEKQISNYAEVDFYLARVAFEKKDLVSAEKYLVSYLNNAPNNPQANNNLILLYVNTKQKAKALDRLQKARAAGVQVNAELANSINTMQ